MALQKNKVSQAMLQYKKDRVSLVIRILVVGAAVVTVCGLLMLIGYILIKGVPYLKLSLFEFHYTSENVSMFPAMINTVVITLLSLIIAAPIGIFSAVYLCEYANKNSKIVKVIRIATETLSGVPSIVYGLFGMLFFVTYLKWGYSLIAGGLTLAIMILPLIMRTTEEALVSVPNSLREASYGLGAGKLTTIFKIVLPSAISGILAGVILAIGRIVGETAALIYTAGTVAQIALVPKQSGVTLAVHLYKLSSEGFNTNEAFATAVVLLIIVFLINGLSNLVATQLRRKAYGKD
ncbi:phosphate ABC transporter permease PstA [Paludicola sp. MB14-C6]|uniref:phosphate ABC transporter permease PstA n=1 Tax=Paludihabitans sp. MB14-C6 TaxID=3070656 RepID=UPI0027DDBD34|nr:phosphate ABC transporter permease PstA [Paludicola sp. MB14-C6]WMJ24421.1 phosphate ABC transporter permease PstA [Paludicola sp. MB14-C6]